MSTIKNIIVVGVTYFIVGASAVVGYNAGKTIWENGLGNKVAEKTGKLFNK